MRVLFLDFDGVLNNLGWAKANPGRSIFTCHFGHCAGLDPANVAVLNKIVAATDCTIVFSSSWRVGPNAVQRGNMSLAQAGASFQMRGEMTPDLTEASSTGPLLIAPSRANEIASWIGDNCDPFACSETEFRFVVLDDAPDAWPPRGWEDYGYFCQTSPHVGLTEELGEKAIRWLLAAQA